MSKIFLWWTNIDFKTRLISIVILLISIAISNTVFVMLTAARAELVNADLRLCRDLSILLTHHITQLIQENNIEELKNFIEKFYLSTLSVDYIRLFDVDGNLLFSCPMNNVLLKSQLNTATTFHSLVPRVHIFFTHMPVVNSLVNFSCSVTDSVFILSQRNGLWGFLQLGLSANHTTLYSIRMAQEFSIGVFVFIWMIFVLGMACNFFIIARPVKKILIGLRNIASGNFAYQINDLAKGDIGDLVVGFNEMSKRLLQYEKKNVTQVISEKTRLEALVLTIADGVILLDSELRLLFVNQVAIKVFHWSNKDLIGEIIFQYLPVHVNEALLPLLNSMIRSNCLDDKILQTQEVKIDLHYESLKTFRFLLSTTLSYKTKVLNGFVIAIQDVTRETQLNEAKNQFIGNVSHELRTPLCNIQSFLETLIDYDYRLTMQQKSKFLLIAYAETHRLNALVNDVLDLSRLESEYNYLLTPVALINTVLYIIKASQIIALNKKVQVEVEANNQVENALAHESSLYQVLSNLVTNSLKFTHRGGKIIVRMYPLLVSGQNCLDHEKCAEFVRIEVIDEGIGIDKTYQRQIFDRFMRIENNTHALEGTGLGLSIVKNIVNKHNSFIKVYSEVGIGTSFWFDLSMAS